MKMRYLSYALLMSVVGSLTLMIKSAEAELGNESRIRVDSEKQKTNEQIIDDMIKNKTPLTEILPKLGKALGKAEQIELVVDLLEKQKLLKGIVDWKSLESLVVGGGKPTAEVLDNFRKYRTISDIINDANFRIDYTDVWLKAREEWEQEQ